MPGPAHDAAGAGAGLAAIFATPAAAAINHLLQSASWARERLIPFAGRTVQFDLAPFALKLAIDASGEVAAASADSGAADASFVLTLDALLRVLAAEDNAWQEVQASGDTALAREILFVAQNLRWDAEEDLSRVFGDIAAHRMAQAGSDFLRWQRQAADSFARSAAAYWTDEQPLIAARQDVERFVREVDALRDDVARLEKRIENLDRFVTP